MLLSYLQALFALAVTLGLVLAAAYAVRRFAPGWLVAAAKGGARRLELIETLPLGPGHRLVLIRADGQEKLVLLGEGRFASQDAKAKTS